MAYVLVRLAIPPQIPVYTAFAPRNPPVISTVHQMGATVDWQRRMSMKLVGWSFLTVALSMMARADFSYTETIRFDDTETAGENDSFGRLNVCVIQSYCFGVAAETNPFSYNVLHTTSSPSRPPLFKPPCAPLLFNYTSA